ncbi:unnamed protein product [Caenorhabditis brenneri]
MEANRFAKTLILTSVACLIVYYFPNSNEVNKFFHTESSYLSDPKPIPPESESSLNGEEYWSTEEKELCNNPDVDKTWTRIDALCFAIRRGLELSKIEVISWSNPVLVVYRDMFTKKQIKGYSQVFKRSEVEPEKVFDQNGKLYISSTRIVNGSTTPASIHPEVQSIIDTASRLIPSMNFQYTEPVLGLSYLPGGHITVHHDFVEFDVEAPEEAFLDMGNRMTTFIISVEKADVGGATVFPSIKATVRPNPGDAFMWFDMLENQEIDNSAFHGGCPVIAGRKLITTIWLRSKGQHIFDTVEGKRQSFNARELLR